MKVKETLLEQHFPYVFTLSFERTDDKQFVEDPISTLAEIVSYARAARAKRSNFDHGSAQALVRFSEQSQQDHYLEFIALALAPLQLEKEILTLQHEKIDKTACAISITSSKE